MEIQSSCDVRGFNDFCEEKEEELHVQSCHVINQIIKLLELIIAELAGKFINFFYLTCMKNHYIINKRFNYCCGTKSKSFFSLRSTKETVAPAGESFISSNIAISSNFDFD